MLQNIMAEFVILQGIMKTESIVFFGIETGQGFAGNKNGKRVSPGPDLRTQPESVDVDGVRVHFGAMNRKPKRFWNGYF